jgi:hypothetical protein
MQKLIFFSLIFFTSIQLSISQTEKVILGKIVCNNNVVSNIQITNLVNEKSTVSDNNGDFKILAKPDDMLVFTSINYEYKRKFLEQSDFDSNNIIINLIKKIEQLDEVVVSKTKINPFDEGIYDKIKTYTPAERRLHEARSGIVEPLVNLISGRTASLKKQLIVERNERNLAKISYLYQDEYYTQKLKINHDLIKAFQYFAVEDKKLIENLKTKNKTLIKFRIIQLAQEFNNLQKS